MLTEVISVPTEKRKTMTDTTFFTQCENCEYCVKELCGYVCDKHLINVDNPKKDGCTWGAEKEDGERREGE